MGATAVFSMMKATVGSPMTPVRLSTSWYCDRIPTNFVMVTGSLVRIMSTPPVRRVAARWVVSGMGLKVIWSRWG